MNEAGNIQIIGKTNFSFGVAYDTEGDSECALLQYWANLEAKYLKDLPKAREIWNSIMNQGHRKSAQWWLAYIQFEKYVYYKQVSNRINVAQIQLQIYVNNCLTIV